MALEPNVVHNVHVAVLKGHEPPFLKEKKPNTQKNDLFVLATLLSCVCLCPKASMVRQKAKKSTNSINKMAKALSH